MSDHEVESIVVLPLPPRYRLKDLLLGEQHSEDDRSVLSPTAYRVDTVYRTVQLIHDLLFLPISTIESAVGKRLITHCCVSRLACSRLSGHIQRHSPRLQLREINTTTTVMN